MKDDHKEPTPTTPDRRPWPSPWKAPAMMFFCLLIGVAFSLGHHEYYKSFDGNLVKSDSQQQWAVRIGTGLAFLMKTAFTAVVGVAFSQYLWVIARRKPLTLRSLDAAFTLTSSPTSFFDLSVLRSAKLLVLIGITSWQVILFDREVVTLIFDRLLPLVALVTPATLTVESKQTTNFTSQLVSYPNFDTTNGITSLGEPVGNIWSDYMGAGYLHAASPAVTRLLAAVSSGMSIIPVAAPYVNSSYSIQFYGPCLKCQSMKDALSSHDYNDSVLSQQWSDFGRPELGIFYNATIEPGYNTILIATGPTDRTNSGGVNITCQLRNASYMIDVTFEQGIPSTTISSLALDPVLNYNDSTLIQDLPPNGSRAYISMLLALGALLSGGFGFEDGTSSAGMTGGTLPVVSTGLLACPEIIGTWIAAGGTGLPPEPPLNETTSPWMCRNGSLRAAIKDLSHNFTLSLLSSGLFSTPRLANVSKSFPMNYYVYHPKELAISYLTGLGVTLACLLIGAWACQSNGHSALHAGLFSSLSTS